MRNNQKTKKLTHFTQPSHFSYQVAVSHGAAMTVDQYSKLSIPAILQLSVMFKTTLIPQLSVMSTASILQMYVMFTTFHLHLSVIPYTTVLDYILAVLYTDECVDDFYAATVLGSAKSTLNSLLPTQISPPPSPCRRTRSFLRMRRRRKKRNKLHYPRSQPRDRLVSSQ